MQLVRVLAILQARVSSTRLPRKVLLPLLGEPMLARQIERIRRAQRIDKLIVATSSDPSDDPLEALCSQIGVECYRGSLNDVLDRFAQAAMLDRPDHVVRLTGDCPLTDPQLIDRVIVRHLSSGADYTSNVAPPSFPDGLDVEVMRLTALEAAHQEAALQSEREHVTQYLVKHPDFFMHASVCSEVDLSHLRWTVDEPDDLQLVERVYAALYPANPAFGMQDVLRLLDEQPELITFNTAHQRNEGLAISIARDEAPLRE
ncbi:glycosyltransferase family protein [Viridibacterium curvum]|uniref:Glycosyltransferase family protein n=1 Tax=Viridibacterium curvum TaxID=1101404 RepID=A0ABP9QA04_9RHOO